MMIAATGLVEPRDPRNSADKSQMPSDLRADSKSQLGAKALGMMLDSASMAKHQPSPIIAIKLPPMAGPTTRLPFTIVELSAMAFDRPAGSSSMLTTNA